jgi:hypothetical protein
LWSPLLLLPLLASLIPNVVFMFFGPSNHTPMSCLCHHNRWTQSPPNW